MNTVQVERLAMVAVALAGFTWGIYWIPLRALDQAGLTGVWAILLFYLVPTVLLAPLLVIRRRQLIAGGWSLHVAGILAGVSLVLYAGALIFTDVVRALLLYYLTPIWSTLLAWMVLGEAISRLRWVTIGLGALGLGLLLRIDAGLIAPFNTGDWMGFGAGLIWAMAAVWMRKHQDISGTDFTLSYFLWGSVAACILVTLSFASGESAPTWTMLNGVLPWLVPLVVILVIPPAFAVMWGATVLSPGLLAILFMTEISAGTVTAALFAQEPLGWREVLGVLVISAAGVLEPVMAARNVRKSRS